MAIRITLPPTKLRWLRSPGRGYLKVGYGLAAALTALVLWFAIARPVQVLPRIRPTPAFTLTSQDGRWLSDQDLRGHVVLMSFAYARCGSDCDALETSMRSVRDQLQRDGVLGTHVQLVTISLDPQHDTPAVLRTYAARFGAQADNWQFLTGMPSEVKQVVGGGFGVYYRAGMGEIDGTQLTFDQRAVLIDGSGTIRAEYAGDLLNPAIVSRDVALIAREEASAPLERPIYEAAHLFVCYPQ